MSSEDNLVLLDDRPGAGLDDHMVDLFCGCGGSGGGLLEAAKILKRSIRGTFVNHWDKAIRIHSANHPGHRHFEEDLFLLDPTTIFAPGTACSLLWASPQCTFFSVARGAACVNEQERSHANHLRDWVQHLNPEGVLVENVSEFRDWGPVVQKRESQGPCSGELMWTIDARPIYSAFDEKYPKRRLLPEAHRRGEDETEEAWMERMTREGYQPYEVPDKSRKGEYFRMWLERMHELGYDSDYRVLKSADYGDPTIRRRLFIYFVRRDTGKKIVWPEPYAQDPKRQAEDPRPMDWMTARQCIDWSVKGTSVFTRQKRLADNTFRRLAIGLVKYGLKDYLEGRQLSRETGEFLTPNFGERPGQTPRTHDVDEPVSMVTSHGAGGVTQSHCVEVTPMMDNHRGTGVVRGVDEPMRTQTAGGSHQALAEAFMFAIDQSGGERKNDGTYPVDHPVRTLVTKANQACIEVGLEEMSGKFLAVCDEKGVDVDRAATFLGFLVDELKRRGRVDAKPWVYVYYSSGSEGKDIDEPLPTVRTKAGHALVYPMIELDGKLLKIDLLYRMLTPLELQRAMGFPDDMEWAGCNDTEIRKAIGNSVSHGVARALGLAWYSQAPDVWPRVRKLYEGKAVIHDYE